MRRYLIHGRLIAFAAFAMGAGALVGFFALNPCEGHRAQRESGGVVTGVRDTEWELKRRIAQDTPDCARGCEGAANAEWYQDNFEPNFSCSTEMRLGPRGDGGKWVCNPHSLLGRPCLVYSIGSENDFRFEEAVHALLPHCEIHTFDPTIGTTPSNCPEYVHFHPWGIGTGEGVLLTLDTIVRRLSHQGRTIDIFKIDCEGCEFEHDFWNSDTVLLRQIQLEIHGNNKLPTMEHAGRTVLPSDFRVLHGIKSRGYVVFHKEPNIKHNPSCVEYAFLRLEPSFFARKSLVKL